MLAGEPDFQVIGTCGSTSEAFKLLGREQADVVLLDYDLGDEQGSLFLQTAREKGFAGRTLIVTAGMNDPAMVRAFETGAHGVFFKNSSAEELLNAIRMVFRGQAWLSTKAVRSLVTSANLRNHEQDTPTVLNGRERAVLKAVFQGLTNKEIAGDLQISESAVKAVLQQLFDKAGVRTRGQLVRIALEKHSEDWLGT